MSKKILQYIKLIRPKHWVKNLLIFAPLIFSGNLTGTPWVLEGIQLFVAFSFLASTIYVINDMVDMNEDRLHPKKKHRPIASGAVSRKEAGVLVTLLLACDIVLCLLFPIKVVIALGIYFLCNLLYSFWLKHVPLVDIFLVSLMYLLRILSGGELWDIPISEWLILCTFFLSLFLISGKRRAEFCELGGAGGSRKVLQFYSKGFLDHLLTIATTSCLVTYSLYVVSIQKPYLIYSLIFVAFGLLRYLYLVHEKSIGQSPESELFSDKWLLLVITLWAATNLLIFYMF